MRPEGVAAAVREVKRAVRAHSRISRAETPEDAEDEWTVFLGHAGKVYTKLRAACYGHPRDFGWFGKKLDDRARDPLLLYIHKARNSDTHRLERLTEDLKPLPVVDEHGVVYPVPTEHLGRDISNADVVTIAYYAAMYLQDLCAEAISRLR
jgi:hypothetical protein